MDTKTLHQLYKSLYAKEFIKLASTQFNKSAGAYYQMPAKPSRVGTDAYTESSLNPDISQTGTSDENPATPGKPGQGKRPAVTDAFVMGILAPSLAKQKARPTK